MNGRCERSWKANERVEISNDLRIEGVRAYVSRTWYQFPASGPFHPRIVFDHVSVNPSARILLRHRSITFNHLFAFH